MPKFEIIEARAFHCGEIVRKLRPSIVAAMTRLGMSPHAELRARFADSAFRRAWLIDGELMAIGGVTGTGLATEGYVWLALANSATKYPHTIIREIARQMGQIMATRALVYAYILPGDDVSRRFAIAIGFRAGADGRVEYRAEWAEPRDPFIVFGLPRSRTRWLSEFLNCSHDAVLSAGSVDELCQTIGRNGSVETGLAPYWRALRQRFPGARFAVVLRPIAEVEASAAQHGWTFPADYLKAQQKTLHEISRAPGVLTVTYDALRRKEVCEQIFEHCTATPTPRGWWSYMAARNIQIDMQQRLGVLKLNSDRMIACLTELASYLTIQRESFDNCLADARPLMEEHATEAAVLGNEAFDPNIEMYRALDRQGDLLVMTARRPDIGVIGYLFFITQAGLENKNIRIAIQNVFFVRRGYRGTLGPKLHDAARKELAAIGVSTILMRSGVRAKGPKQKFLFERLGAKYVGALYSLDLER